MGGADRAGAALVEQVGRELGDELGECVLGLGVASHSRPLIGQNGHATTLDSMVKQNRVAGPGGRGRGPVLSARKWWKCPCGNLARLGEAAKSSWLGCRRDRKPQGATGFLGVADTAGRCVPVGAAAAVLPGSGLGREVWAVLDSLRSVLSRKVCDDCGAGRKAGEATGRALVGVFTGATSVRVCSIPSLTLPGAASAATRDAAARRQAAKRSPRSETALPLTPAVGCGKTFSQDLVRPKQVARPSWMLVSPPFGG